MHRLKMGGRIVLGRRILTSLFSLLFLLCLFSGFQNAFANGVPALVETKWLADNLKNPDIRIVYVDDLSPQDRAGFDAKHIPNSVFLSALGLHHNLNAQGSAGMVPEIAQFETVMGKLGISNDTHVVLYGKGSGNPFITRAFWLMKYYGHKKLSLLNGGIAKWNKENRKTAGKPAKIISRKYKTGSSDSSILAKADYVLQNLKNPKVAIVDTRALDEYNGTKSYGNKRTGHIPGAVLLNFYPTNLKNDGTFKSLEDLKAAYEAKGITKDKEIITYCQSGVRAAHTYFVLKHILGYPNVRNYTGSIDEWANKMDPAKYPLKK